MAEGENDGFWGKIKGAAGNALSGGRQAALAGTIAAGLSGAPINLDLSTMEITVAEAMAGPKKINEVSRAQQELLVRRAYDVLKQRKATDSGPFEKLAKQWNDLPYPKTASERKYTDPLIITRREKVWPSIISGIPAFADATSIEVRAFASEKDKRVWLQFTAKEGNEIICQPSFADNEPTLLPVK